MRRWVGMPFRAVLGPIGFVMVYLGGGLVSLFEPREQLNFPTINDLVHWIWKFEN